MDLIHSAVRVSAILNLSSRIYGHFRELKKYIVIHQHIYLGLPCEDTAQISLLSFLFFFGGKGVSGGSTGD